MDARDELLTIAELAVGIAGFSGVVAVFLQDSGLHPLDRSRFINLFMTAFATVFLAFVPLLFAGPALSGPDLWRLSSGIMILAWIVNTGFAVRFVQPHLQEHFSPSTRRRALSVVLVPGVLNLLVQVLNAIGTPWSPTPKAYIFGLLVYLYAAGFMFTYIILFRPERAA